MCAKTVVKLKKNINDFCIFLFIENVYSIYHNCLDYLPCIFCECHHQILNAYVNVAGHAVADTVSILATHAKININDMKNILVQSVIAGISATASIELGAKLYKLFYDSLEPKDRKNLAVLFDESSTVFHKLVTSPGPDGIHIATTDVQIILQSMKLVNSITSLTNTLYLKSPIRKCPKK